MVDMMSRNIDGYYQQYQDTRDERFEVQTFVGRVVRAQDFERLRQTQPDWYRLGDGIHNIRGVEDDGTPFYYKLAVRKTPQEWYFLAYNMTETERSVARFRQFVYLAIPTLALLSLLLGWWSASKVMSPVTDLARRLRLSSSEENREALAPNFADDEVGELAKAFDDYADRLTEVVNRDREFNADVSHELRTPLAVIKGAVELLLSRPDIDEKTRTRLERIQRAEEQGTELISALLMLSRNERAHGHTNIADLAEHLLDAHRAQMGHKPIELIVEGNPDLIVDAPEEVVSVALGNLIGNAVKYTLEGWVKVRVLDNAVEVIDTGPGLSDEDAAKLFQRGYRGSHAEHTQGGGIGLSIVERLCALYGWTPRVRPGVERGVIARLSFGDEQA